MVTFHWVRPLTVSEVQFIVIMTKSRVQGAVVLKQLRVLHLAGTRNLTVIPSEA